MADIFHEVDEEVRRERLQKLWDRYSIYIIGLAVLIVAAIGAWRGYEYWQAKQAAAAGAAFEVGAELERAGQARRGRRRLRQDRGGCASPAIAPWRACAPPPNWR